MSESRTHVALVSEIVSYVGKRYAEHQPLMILTDAAGVATDAKPPRVNGFVPDVYAKAVGESFCIIGEAKTFRDVDREHSLSQLSAFAGHLAKFDSAVLILAVPLFSIGFARSIVRMLRLEEHGVVVECIHEGSTSLEDQHA